MANQLHDLLERVALGPLDAPTQSAVSPGGWPVEAADVYALEPRSEVAVCTLGSPELSRTLAGALEARPAVVGPMATENIGVEKLVRNVLAHPSILSVVLCGPETGGTALTGHFAGDALCCLHRLGAEPKTGRIVGARGRRPYVRNLLPDEIAAFRHRVRLVDLIGETDVRRIGAAVGDGGAACVAAVRTAPLPGATSAGPTPAGAGPAAPIVSLPEVVEAALPTRYVPDPAGYVLIFADRVGGRLVLEHYTNEGWRSSILVGDDPRALMASAVERGLVSRLDHAGYLGRELTRAADALARGELYVQDAVPHSDA